MGYRKMDVIRELREILLSIQTGFSLVNAAVICAILESISGLEPSSVITEPSVWSLWLSQASVHSLWSLCWCHCVDATTVLFFISLVLLQDSHRYLQLNCWWQYWCANVDRNVAVLQWWRGLHSCHDPCMLRVPFIPSYRIWRRWHQLNFSKYFSKISLCVWVWPSCGVYVSMCVCVCVCVCARACVGRGCWCWYLCTVQWV